MKDPIALTRVGRCFKPTLRRNNVRAPIAIHIPGADAMSPAHGADLMLDPWIGCTFTRQLVPSQREIPAAKLRQELERFAGIENVDQKSKLHRRSSFDDLLAPWAVRLAGILPPGQRLRPVGTAHQVGI